MQNFKNTNRLWNSTSMNKYSTDSSIQNRGLAWATENSKVVTCSLIPRVENLKHQPFLNSCIFQVDAFNFLLGSHDQMIISPQSGEIQRPSINASSHWRFLIESRKFWIFSKSFRAHPQVSSIHRKINRCYKRGIAAAQIGDCRCYFFGLTHSAQHMELTPDGFPFRSISSCCLGNLIRLNDDYEHHDFISVPEFPIYTLLPEVLFISESQIREPKRSQRRVLGDWVSE